jgi:hypothetical protein
MMKKFRRRLQRFLGSSNDLSELPTKSNGVHLISATHHQTAYTDINRNPKKMTSSMHFNDLTDSISTEYGGVYHPSGNLAKSVPNGLHNRHKPHITSDVYAHRNQPLDRQQYYNINKYNSRPSSVYSLYNSQASIYLFGLIFTLDSRASRPNSTNQSLSD